MPSEGRSSGKPISTTSRFPISSYAGIFNMPCFTAAMVTVRSAAMHSGAASPVSQSIPDGQSTATTRGWLSVSSRMPCTSASTSANSPFKGSLTPVPSTPSTPSTPDTEPSSITPVTPPAGLPVVTLADDGAPSITVPADATKPTTLVAQTLIKGAGPAVQSGQTITAQYSGWLWDGTAFDSSWTNGSPFQTKIGVGAVIPGWDQALVGQTVGSQVLLVVPPDLGYQDKDNGPIPANSTLIFVIDILDAAGTGQG